MVAALGLSACASSDAPVTTPPAPPPATTAAPAAPPSNPLPAPQALTDVLYRMADTGVPGAEKTGVLDSASAADAAALDKFGRALEDNGFAPVTFEAHDLRRSPSDPANVVATVVVIPAEEQAGEFRFPMEFTSRQGRWQLTHETAELLLQLGETPGPTPTG